MADAFFKMPVTVLSLDYNNQYLANNKNQEFFLFFYLAGHLKSFWLDCSHFVVLMSHENESTQAVTRVMPYCC
jgi:hypothetical protein